MKFGGCINIEPIAGNKVVVKSADDLIQVEISGETNGRAMSIVISKNAVWEIDKTFEELGDRNYINIKLKEIKKC